jgi:DNA-binding MurR/RpiR family transcriptional regulator
MYVAAYAGYAAMRAEVAAADSRAGAMTGYALCIAAVEAGGAGVGMRTWALTGAPGNPLAGRSHDCLCVDTPHTATVQEIHLIAIHLLCAAVDEALASPRRFRRAVVV